MMKQLRILLMSDFLLEEEKYFISDVIDAVRRGSIEIHECARIIDEASSMQQERIISWLC